MGSENPKEAPCACGQRFMDLARAYRKDGGLIKVTCKGCGKTFLSNVEKEYCYDCSRK